MKAFISLWLLFILSLTSFGQVVLKGKILTETGQPLAGASVRFKSPGTGTFSDKNGDFSLSAASLNDTLLVSFIGYTPIELAISMPRVSPLIISMSPQVREMEEVRVSTGYYQIPAERLTGSFTQIDRETLNRSNSSDILGRLKGVSNSILFDERNEREPKISVRGLSTIYAIQQPLIVLNNFPYEGDIQNINPNDVESISILKDAAAASIWGVRAANGVIVITTKTGPAGKKPELNFHSTFTLGNKPDMYYNPGMSSADFIAAEEFLFNKGFYKGMESDPSHPALTPAVELFIARRDGSLSQTEANAGLAQLAGHNVRDDFGKYVYQNSLSQQYSLDLRGGSEINSYYFSAAYDRNSDYTAALYDRFTLRADQVFSLGRLKLKPSISYSTGTDINGRQGIGNITPGQGMGLFPYARLADEKGNPLPLVKDYRASYVQNAETAGLLNWQYVPLEDYRLQEVRTGQSGLILNMGADYRLSSRFIARMQYQYENSRHSTRDWKGEDSYFARDLINRFTQDDGSGSLTFEVPRGAILDLISTSMASHSGRAQLEYSSSWDKHSLDALAGAELRDISNGGNLYRTYGYSDDGLLSAPVNYNDYFPMYQNAGDYQPIPSGNDFTDQLNRYTAWYVNAAYTYDKRYIISASGRKDASNLFGVKSNQRGVPLWSAGMAWNIHHEQFFSPEWLDLLKLRFTYGYNGNLDRNLSALATIYQFSGNMNNRPYGFIRSYPNPELSWEKISVFNAGLDFGFKNNALSGSLEYYVKQGKNLIGDQPIDPTVGLVSGTIRRNVANMSTRGLDLQLSSWNMNKAFKWNTALLFSYNRNNIESYYMSGTSTALRYLNGGRSIVPVEGKPVYSVFSYPWAGLDPVTGDPMGYLNGNPGKNYSAIASATTVKDLQYHGAALPPVFGALSNTFSYKALSLYINMAYKFGYYFRRQSIFYGQLYTRWYGHQDFAKRWQKPGDEQHTSVPSMVFPASYGRDDFYANSAALIEKGDHIRFQDLKLSYRLQGKNLKAPFNDMELYTNARNLGFIWRANKERLDPDYSGAYLPPSYSISFGLRTKFK